jgi:hypothetical protein
MKRREFLKVSTSLAAGVAFSGLAHAKPCPPFSVSTGGQTVVTPCGVVPTGTAPTWFLNAPYNTWNQIAGDASSNLAQALAQPLPENGGACNPNSVLDAWCGGGVDQSRNEYLLCANGGHADGADNSCYALALTDASPRWRRLSNPTPNSLIDFGPTAGPNGFVYQDGRPRAMHSTFETFGDGRVWFPLQNSAYNGAGDGANAVLSFDRNFPALVTADQAKTPLAWTNNLGPWSLHGPVTPNGQLISSAGFGVGVFDRVDHKIWGLGGNGTNYTPYWVMDTTGPNLGKSSFYFGNKPFGHFGGWAVVAHDLRILVAGCTFTKTICVLDLTNPLAPNAWTQVSNVTGPPYYNAASGGVYVRANRSIFIGNPNNSGATIYKLQIPTAGNGYDAAGQWIWSTIIPAGQAPNTFARPANNGAYSKWNIVEDMGNGEAALIFVASINGPLYWVRISASGL